MLSVHVPKQYIFWPQSSGLGFKVFKVWGQGFSLGFRVVGLGF